MAKRFVSAGVFTSEVDVSVLPQAVGAIGGAFIGLAEKGPAFVPYRVSNFNEFAEVFGNLNENYPLSYLSRAYLKNSAAANVVRVLGPAGRSVNGTSVTPGYSAQTVWGVTAATGSSTGVLHALLEITASAALVVNDLTNDKFELFITGSSIAASDGRIVSVTASFLTSSADYIKKVLNTDPTKFSQLGYFVREVYDYAFKYHVDGNATYGSASYGGMTNLQVGFNSGSTPWISSQEFGGSTEYNLFRIHTLGHGVAENGRFKISVSNIKNSVVPSVNPYGTFDLEVRSFADTDKNKILVEFFPGMDLNPSSVNYIEKRIGSQYWQYDVVNDKMVNSGDYRNISKLIRVEMTTGSFPQEALPWGFRGLAKPNLMVTSGSISGLNVGSVGLKDLPVVKDLKDKETQGETKSYVYWGTEFDLSGSVKSRLSLMPVMTGSDADFSLKLISGSSESTLVYNASNPTASKKVPGSSTGHTSLEPKYAKFTVPVAFGFDGFDIRLENPLANESQLLTVSQLGTQALRQGVDTIKDPDFIDINLLAIPGIHSAKVVEYGLEKMEERADAFYVVDITGSTVTTAINEVNGRGYNSSYGGVYYSEIKIVDPVANKIVTVPASVGAVGAIAYNDRVAYPWNAPAGFNRGGLNLDTIGFTVTDVKDRLKKDERDDLYENRINPIASFPGEGIVIWGQKTLQIKDSALNRVNVRRLLIRAKKLVASAIKFLVFEGNDPQTWTRFKQIVNPILEDIRSKNGLTAFKVVMDETTNTPDLIDRNIMTGKIQLIPTRVAEIIDVPFVINRSGATFED